MSVSPFPEELPALISCAGECRDVADRLYECFCSDFQQASTKHRNVPVRHDRNVGALGMEDGFWHLITREEKGDGKERFLEVKRAEKVAWAHPLIECGPHPKIRVWDYDTGNKRKGIRTFIWLEDHDYVAILKRAGQAYFLVTAYDVDGPHRRKYFERLYENRV